MIEDFAEDNVRYLELRSTPRANPKSGIAKFNVFFISNRPLSKMP